MLAFFTEDGGQFEPQRNEDGGERHDVTFANATGETDPAAIEALEQSRGE